MNLPTRNGADIRPMLPNKPRGVPYVDNRLVLNGISWVLRSCQISSRMSNKNQNLGGSRARRWYAYLWHEWTVESRRPIAPAFARPNPAEWSDNRITAAWLGHATVLINFFGNSHGSSSVSADRNPVARSYTRTQTPNRARADHSRPPQDRHRASFPRALRSFRHAHAPSISSFD